MSKAHPRALIRLRPILVIIFRPQRLPLFGRFIPHFMTLSSTLGHSRPLQPPAHMTPQPSHAVTLVPSMNLRPLTDHFATLRVVHEELEFRGEPDNTQRPKPLVLHCHVNCFRFTTDGSNMTPDFLNHLAVGAVRENAVGNSTLHLLVKAILEAIDALRQLLNVIRTRVVVQGGRGCRRRLASLHGVVPVMLVSFLLFPAFKVVHESGLMDLHTYGHSLCPLLGQILLLTLIILYIHSVTLLSRSVSPLAIH